MNGMPNALDVDTSLGSFHFEAGPFARLVISDLKIELPGVQIEGDFVVSGSGSGGGDMIAATNVSIFVGGGTGTNRIGLQLLNGQGFFYRNGEHEAGEITGQVSIVGVPGLDLSATLTVRLSDFTEAVDQSVAFAGETIQLVFDVTEIAQNGKSFVEINAQDISFSLLDVFQIAGDLSVRVTSDTVLVGGSNLSLYVGVPADDPADRLGFQITELDFGLMVHTAKRKFAIHAIGSPSFVGVGQRIGLLESGTLTAGFIYNNTGEDVDVLVPTGGADSFNLQLSADANRPTITGSIALDFGRFAELSGDYSLLYDGQNGHKLMFGLANVKVFVGGGEGNDRVGVEASIDQMGLMLDLDQQGRLPCKGRAGFRWSVSMD